MEEEWEKRRMHLNWAVNPVGCLIFFTFLKSELLAK
jgi:hypothetical protein